MLRMRAESDVLTEIEEKGNFMYIVRCSDDTLYTGWTNHLTERIRAHNAGKGARYTRSRRPVELVYYETFATREEAMSREAQVKRLTRAGKLSLIGRALKEQENGRRSGESGDLKMVGNTRRIRGSEDDRECR